MRTVCFEKSKRSLFEEYENKNIPIQIKKFRLDTSANSEDLVIDNHSIIQKLPEVEFDKATIPDTITVSIINTIDVGQLITLKAKVVHLGETDRVKSQHLILKEAIIADPTGSTRLVLWEQFGEQIKQGNTYLFKNLRIKKNSSTNEVYINTAKTGTEITEADAFTEQLTLTIKDDYLNITRTG